MTKTQPLFSANARCSDDADDDDGVPGTTTTTTTVAKTRKALKFKWIVSRRAHAHTYTQYTRCALLYSRLTGSPLNNIHINPRKHTFTSYSIFCVCCLIPNRYLQIIMVNVCVHLICSKIPVINWRHLSGEPFRWSCHIVHEYLIVAAVDWYCAYVLVCANRVMSNVCFLYPIKRAWFKNWNT